MKSSTLVAILILVSALFLSVLSSADMTQTATVSDTSSLKTAWSLNNEAFDLIKQGVTDDGYQASTEQMTKIKALLEEALVEAQKPGKDFSGERDNRASCIKKIKKNLKFIKARIFEAEQDSQE